MHGSMTPQFPTRKGSGRWGKSLFYGALSVAFGALGAGAVGLLAQLQSLTVELAAARRDLAATKERIGRLEKRLEEGPIDQAFRQLPGARARPSDEEDQPQQPLQLSREEIQVVKDYIKLPPPPPGVIGLVTLGSVVPVG